MSTEKQILCNENFVVFFSDHPTFTIGTVLSEGKIKLAVRKGYTVKIMYRGAQ